jgi:hypothetical protein
MHMSAVIEGDGTSNDNTAVTIIPAPAANTSRQLKFLSVQNADSVAAIVTIQLNVGGTKRTTWRSRLEIGEQLTYVDARGWFVLDPNGNLKQSGATGTTGGGSGGSGNVTGPPSSSADRIATYADTTGKIIKDSGIVVTDVARLSVPNTFIANQVISKNVPVLSLIDLSQSVDQRRFDIVPSGGNLIIQTVNDAQSANYGGIQINHTTANVMMTNQLRTESAIRAEGGYGVNLTGVGPALEIGADNVNTPSTGAYILGFNRTSGQYVPITIGSSGVTFNSNVSLNNVNPELIFVDTSQPTDQKTFRIINANQQLYFQSMNDAQTAASSQSLVLNRLGDATIGHGLKTLGAIRVEGSGGTLPSGMIGIGAEIFAQNGYAYFHAYDRTNGVYAPISLYGTSVTIDNNANLIVTGSSSFTQANTFTGANAPYFIFNQNSAPVDSRIWRLIGYGDGNIRFECLNDAQSIYQSVPLALNRTGDIAVGRNLTVGGSFVTNGIQFPSAQVDSSDPNTLDDYEEGTWIPTLGGEGGEDSQIYQTGKRNGSYIKIGNKVTAGMYIQFDSSQMPNNPGQGNIYGHLVLKGFPFACGGGSANYALSIGLISNLAGISGVSTNPRRNIFGNMVANTTYAYLYSGDDLNARNMTFMIGLDVNTATQLIASITYRTHY